LRHSAGISPDFPHFQPPATGGLHDWLEVYLGLLKIRFMKALPYPIISIDVMRAKDGST
jgi:hypothetical protein